MSYNNRRSSGGRSFGRRDFNRGPREMFQAVCSNCGKTCEVPFRPTGSKPVYCSDCFEAMGGGQPPRRHDDRGDRGFKPRFEERSSRPAVNNDQINALNAKLDKILAILNSETFVKSSPKPEIIPEEVSLSIEPVEQKTPKAEKKKRTVKKGLPPMV